MAIKRDNIHYSTRKIDGYNLPFNFVISERETGKSTAIILDKIYKPFKEHGYTSIVIRRNVNDLTTAYIDDFQNYINKFYDDDIHFKYSVASLKDGIVDIKIDGKPFIRFIGLSKRVASFKSLMFPNLHTILFDEFICNPEFSEKYLQNEATKFMEIYNTFRRESINLKCYFLGNPYSLFNPYFLFFNIQTKDIKRGVILSDSKTYVMECAELTPELRALILKNNPLYQFDNSYTRYAFNGEAINDMKIRIKEGHLEGYPLRFVFHIENKFIGVYKKQNVTLEDFVDPEAILFYAEFLDLSKISRRRDIFCFDFSDLVNRTSLLSNEDKWRFADLKKSMRERKIVFSSIECYYLFEEIFFNI